MTLQKNSHIKFILILSISISYMIIPICNSQNNANLSANLDGWEIIEGDDITIAIPSEGIIPMFIYWYNEDDTTIYIVKYEGLTETWLFSSDTFRHNMFFDDTISFETQFMTHAHQYGWIGDSSITPKIYKASENFHPFFFSFSEGIWDFIEIQEIISQDGKIIGIAFAFKLSELKNLKFNFIQESIIIINRIYFFPVEEKIGENENFISKSELKSEIIISNWEWNFDYFIQSLGKFADQIPILSPKLILNTDLSVRQITEENRLKIMNEEKNGLQSIDKQISSKLLKVGEKIYEINGSLLEEDDISSTDGVSDVKILTQNSVIESFFKFNSEAYLIPKFTNTNDDGYYNKTNIEGVFWAINGQLKIFIVYPYFENSILRHDPSIGISQIGSENQNPQYIIELPEQIGEITPPSKSIIHISALLYNVPYLELMMAAVLFTLIIVTAIVLIKKTNIEILSD